MYIIYHPERGWSINYKIETDDHYVGALQGDYKPWDPQTFTDLEPRFIPLTSSACQIWAGTYHGCAATINAIPYYVISKYSGALRRSIRHPKQIPARQLILAKRLNFHYTLLPSNMKLGINCDSPGCINLEHIVPYNYRPRTKKGEVIVTEIVAPQTEMSEEEKKRIQRSVNASIERSRVQPQDVRDMLPKSGRTAADFTPEENAAIERARNRKSNEGVTTLDDIAMPTKPPQG